MISRTRYRPRDGDVNGRKTLPGACGLRARVGDSLPTHAERPSPPQGGPEVEALRHPLAGRPRKVGGGAAGDGRRAGVQPVAVPDRGQPTPVPAPSTSSSPTPGPQCPTTATVPSTAPARPWTDLPILTREQIQAAGADLVSTDVPADHLPLTDMTTSGSTGRPLTVKATPVTGLFWLVCTLRDHLWHGRDATATVVDPPHRPLRPDPARGPGVHRVGPSHRHRLRHRAPGDDGGAGGHRGAGRVPRRPEPGVPAQPAVEPDGPLPPLRPHRGRAARPAGGAQLRRGPRPGGAGRLPSSSGACP